jgi:ankyrin repeat protein
MMQNFRHALNKTRRHAVWALLGFSLLIAQFACLPPAAAADTAAVALPDAIKFGVRVEQGDVKTVGEWLAAGLDPNFEGDRIGTGLMIAAWGGDVAMMALFVTHGADVNRANRFNEQALMLAAWTGQRDAAAWLLDHGAQINREGNEWSALHYAAFAGHDEIAKMLIQKKADVNAKSTNGSTVLMMAAREGREKIAAMLIEAGAMRGTKNDFGEDALTWAMRNGHLTIAKMVTSDNEFEEAAAQPRASWGEPSAPIPAPAEVEEILQQERLAHVSGKPLVLSDDDYRKILDRIAKMKLAAIASRRPQRMSITAQKSDPSKERAELQFGDTRLGSAAHRPGQ